MNFRLLIILIAILFPLLNLNAQDKHKIDSLAQTLKKTKDPVTKFELYKALSSVEHEKKKYKSDKLLNAELNGNADLQLRTYRLLAELSGIDSGQIYLDKMFALAKEKRNV